MYGFIFFKKKEKFNYLISQKFKYDIENENLRLYN